MGVLGPLMAQLVDWVLKCTLYNLVLLSIFFSHAWEFSEVLVFCCVFGSSFIVGVVPKLECYKVEAP